MKRRINHVCFPSNNKISRTGFNDREKSNHSSGSCNTIQDQRQSLPVYKYRKRLEKEIQKSPTLIIIGETGSGKTTQIPQFINDSKLCGDGICGITQPRRVAAVTVAQRVAKEMNQELGHIVGYLVRFEDCTSKETKIKYLTDGMLLREAMGDVTLKAYSSIILDEAHERTVHTDVLFGIVKAAQKKRSESSNPLKIIVMSATMDVDHFQRYFNNATVIYLEGRQYPVQIFHTATHQQDYNFACLNTIFKIHREAPVNHDMLVFLTGQEEIESMAASIRSILKDREFKGPQAKVLTLYAAMSHSRQAEVFSNSHNNSRKIILSTNIAETSVTISGIKYVIDSGKVKSRSYQPSTGIEQLKVHSISQAQAWQRTGRAGRDSPGSCYRTYSEKEYNELTKVNKPEILRCNLATVLLQLLGLKVDARNFDFMDKPDPESVDEGYKMLRLLGAVQGDDSPELTDIGRKMVNFPLDPRFSKVILSAENYGCMDEVLTIIAFLCGENIFINNTANRREEVSRARSKFASPDGDHITLLNIYNGYSAATIKYLWTYENFLNYRNMEYALKVRQQLQELCERQGIPSSSCGQDLDKLKQCLITGFFMNVAHLQKDGKYAIVCNRQPVMIHPGSVVHGSQPPLVLFTELVRTGRSYIRHLTPIQPDWLNDVAPPRYHCSSASG